MLYIHGDMSINAEEQAYLDFLNDIMKTGHRRETRNGTTLSVFSRHLQFDLHKNGFPLLTTKLMFWRGVVEELKFFMSGKTDAKLLKAKKVGIWDGNTCREFLDSVGLNHYDEGDMGPLYGFQWRHFGATYRGCDADYTGEGVDQLQQIINILSTDPFSRRAFMTTFHTDQLTQSPLPPCHGLCVQFGVTCTDDSKMLLNCHMYQRSCDAFLGCPFNIASYALLVHLMCAIINNTNNTNKNPNQLTPGTLTMSFGDCHIYEGHLDAVKLQLSRTPKPFPKLTLKGNITLDAIDTLTSSSNPEKCVDSNIILENYQSHPTIKASMVP